MKPRQKVRSVLRKYQKLPNARPGILGNGAGLVEDFKKPGHNYVRIGNAPPISIINHRTAPIDNQKVWVGYDPLEPNILQVLSIRSIESLAWGGANPFTSTARHASSHRWFERDTVFIDLRQMMPFRPQVDGSMVMQVYHGIAYIGNQWQAMLDSSIDLTSYIPSTGTVYALVYYDTNGDLAVKSSIVKDLNSLIPSDAPSPIINTVPIALVRLWSGMSGIVENRIATDMADVRWMGLFGGGGGGGGGGNVTPNIPSTTYWPDGWNLSDVSPYYNLPFAPHGLKAVNTFVTGSSSNYLYGFLTGFSGLDAIQITAGDWIFDSWFNSQNKNARVYCYVYKRDAGGTETELFNFDYCTLPGLTGQREFVKTLTKPAFNIDPTDRLLVKFYGTDPQNFGYISMWTGIDNTTITVPGFYTSSGTSSEGDEKLKISSADTTANYLEDKLIAGSGIIFVKNNTGANETITISSSGTSYSTGTVNTHDHSGDVGDGGQFAVENLITVETDTTLRLAPDGAGGLEMTEGDAGEKITELPAESAPETTDLLVIVHDPGGSPVTSKALISDVLELNDPTTASGDMIYKSITSVNQATVALGASASAISTLNGYVAGNLIDEDDGTFWSASAPPMESQWVKIDLGSSKSIAGFHIKQYSDLNFNAATFTVETSPNDSTWTSQGTFTRGDGDDEFNFSDYVTTRYVRFTVVTRAGDSGYGWILYTIGIYDHPLPSTSHLERIPIGAEDQVLTSKGGKPSWEDATGGAIADHDHSGDAGDGGTFDAANLTSGAASDGEVLTADGLGGASWQGVSGSSSGDVIAPESATSGNLAVFGADPYHIIDGGAIPASSSPDGWTAAGQVWTYEAADDPTYTFSEPIDATAKYSAGMKIKCTQGGSVKYGIITAVGAYSGGKTIITAYWGTDYNLGATITNPYYSVARSPVGFPLDPTKWMVRVTDATTRSQATPTAGTWYNVNAAHTISIPIGCWDVSYQVSVASAKNNFIDHDIFSTLSTANNSESDNEMSCHGFVDAGVNASGGYLECTFHRHKTLNLAAKTSYYLNVSTNVGGAGTTIYVNSYTSNWSPMILEARCAYL